MNVTSQSALRGVALDCSQKITEASFGEEFHVNPFKHLVVDDFLDLNLANSALDAFPSVEDDVWEVANDLDIEVKFRSNWSSEFDIPEGLLPVIRILNSAMLLNAMAEKFDIPKIVPDPYFTGGGLNLSKAGGLLDVHVDGNYHDATGLNRRLNALLYLNKDWQSGWGGQLGLYDAEGNECLKMIEPVFNRLVIFETHDKSFHGLPDPIQCPPDVGRKSIVLYYYTKEERPEAQITVRSPHSALWKKRGFADKRGAKTRDYY